MKKHWWCDYVRSLQYGAIYWSTLHHQPHRGFESQIKIGAMVEPQQNVLWNLHTGCTESRLMGGHSKTWAANQVRMKVDLANVPLVKIDIHMGDWIWRLRMNLKTDEVSTPNPLQPLRSMLRCRSEKHLNMIALILDLSTRGPRHINIDCRGSRGSPAAFLSCNSFRCLFWVTNNLFFKKTTRQLEPVKWSIPSIISFMLALHELYMLFARVHTVSNGC